MVLTRAEEVEVDNSLWQPLKGPAKRRKSSIEQQKSE